MRRNIQLGAQPSIKGTFGRDLHVKVGDTVVNFTLDSAHAGRQIELENRGYGFQARGETDDLSLVVDEDHSWRDKKGARIESDLAEIARTLVVLGEQRYRDSIIHRYESMVRRRAEQERAVRQRLIDEENKRLEHIRLREKHCSDKLVAQADSHRQAEEIRHWIDVVLRSIAELKEDPAVVQWSEWARAAADRMDPLVSNQELDWPEKSGPLR